MGGDALKRCPKCGEELPRTSEYWGRDRTRRDGLHGHCRPCHAKNRRRWAENNRERVRKYRQEWKRIDRSNNPARYLIAQARARAVKAGLPFNITAADAKVPPVCPVLGIALKAATGLHGPGSPSLDRVIPELGYTKGNVVVVSHRANMIKSNATLPELEAVADYLRRSITQISKGKRPS